MNIGWLSVWNSNNAMNNYSLICDCYSGDLLYIFTTLKLHNVHTILTSRSTLLLISSVHVTWNVDHGLQDYAVNCCVGSAIVLVTCTHYTAKHLLDICGMHIIIIVIESMLIMCKLYVYNIACVLYRQACNATSALKAAPTHTAWPDTMENTTSSFLASALPTEYSL